jgi:toxin YoeB
MSIETTYTAARANLAKLLDSAVEDREIVLIRRRGAESVALIAAEELESLLETAHLLRSPRNAERLLSALQRARARTLSPERVEDLRAELGLGSDDYPSRGEAVFHPVFREDLRCWIQMNRMLALRCMDLIEAILRDPFSGIGKPEPLRYLAPDTWSRRLSQEHRIVYLVSQDRVDFLQARYHY